MDHEQPTISIALLIVLLPVCLEVTKRWGLVHVKKGSESAPSVHAFSV